MRHGHLSEYFTGVAAKTLSSVEVRPDVSHQHELNGVTRLREILGTDRREFPAHLIYLTDEEEAHVEADATLTWYDARERHPTRSEWRLYYPETPVSESASPGDLFVIGRRPDDSLLVFVAQAGSTVANQLLWLFGLGNGDTSGLAVRSDLDTDQDRLDYSSRLILDSVGVVIEAEPESDAFLDRVLERFGATFPTTRAFSAFARDTMPEVDPVTDPDTALIAWMEREEELFRVLEKHLVAERLEQGFTGDVDGFIAYSLSVQNRRKSRAGRALENHLEVILNENRIVYERNALTERQSRPDFLFPDAGHYHDVTIDPELLTVLGAKSTCKDRWRQVLAEADRVPEKHLLTLEGGISVNQTDEMVAQRLQLVLPRPLHDSFRPEQQSRLMDVRSIVQLLRGRQGRLGLAA